MLEKSGERNIIGFSGPGSGSAATISPVLFSYRRYSMDDSGQIADSLIVTIHAMPCTNRCRHCWTLGAPGREFMGRETIFGLLEQIAALRKHAPHVFHYFFFEPTTHPDFVSIFLEAARLELIWDEFFFPTNGAGLSDLADDAWRDLADAGLEYLQFTVFGLESTHDRFACRKGAFNSIVEAASAANRHGVTWTTGIMAHPDNLEELEEVRDRFTRLGATNLGIFTFEWQGRGTGIKRLREADLERLPESVRSPLNRLWVPEWRIVERILKDDEFGSNQPFSCDCELTAFEIFPDMNVYLGGGCDGGGLMAVLPEMVERFRIGSLREEPLAAILTRAILDPPDIVRSARELTWRELAERYGDRSGEELFRFPLHGNTPSPLPDRKWLASYLREKY